MRDRRALWLLALLAVISRRRSSTRGVPWDAAWWWPVPPVRYQGRLYQAVVSDGWGSSRGARTHEGLDIVYRGHRTGDDLVQPAPFWALPGTPITAARAGRVARVVKTARGWSVVVDHGGGLSTFYQHLETTSVQPRQLVAAGQKLGTMGIDPLDAQRVRHLHFEVWHHGKPVDAGPVIGTWIHPGAWSAT